MHFDFAKTKLATYKMMNFLSRIIVIIGFSYLFERRPTGILQYRVM